MKNLFKSLISSAMVLTMSVTAFYGTASAVTLTPDQSDELVSVQEYADTMGQVYAQYGIKWRVVDSSNYVPLTKTELESEVAKVIEDCKAYQTELTKSQEESAQIKKDDAKLASGNDLYAPMVMPITANYSTYKTINCNSVPGSLTLLVRINANADADLGHFQSINSSSIIKYSGVNCDSWSDEGSRIYISSTKLALIVDYAGVAYFSYVEPRTNIKVEQAVIVKGSHTWKVSDGTCF